MQNENKDRKVLLEVRDVKQYFPVKKTKLREKQRYVRANDGVTLDIYEGETLGLVGESGCGKSTLGRTILQLYPQTHGDILYHKDDEAIDLKKQTPGADAGAAQGPAADLPGPVLLAEPPHDGGPDHRRGPDLPRHLQERTTPP